MNVPLWVCDLASRFWDAAGEPGPFPRELRSACTAWPLTIVDIPALRLSKVLGWLKGVGLLCPVTERKRRLRACLFARSEWGFIFLDAADSAAEQRFSLAHELAHFLRHYWHPRELACRKLGRQVLEVLDGRRLPDAAERVHALLASVPIGFHLHLLDRDPEGVFATGTVVAAESEADQLAYELLAPADEVLSWAGHHRGQPLAELLRNTFGLPADHAVRYAGILFPSAPADPLLKRLGLG